MTAIFAPPVFPDDAERTRSARILNVIILLTVGATLLASLNSVLTAPRAPWMYAMWFVLVAVLIAARAWMVRGRVTGAAGLSLAAIGIVIAGTVLADGLHSPGMASFIFVCVLASALVGWRGTMGMTVAICAFVLALTGLQSAGIVVPSGIVLPPGTYGFMLVIQIGGTGLLVALLEAERARTFAAVEAGRVELAERASLQELVATVSQHALTDDSRQLMERILDLLGERLAVHHGFVLREVAERGVLVVDAACTWDRGLVGQSFPLDSATMFRFAADRDEPVVVSGAEEETRFAYPPPAMGSEVRASVAIPFAVGEERCALTVHSRGPREWTSAEVASLRSCANVISLEARREQVQTQLLHSQKLETVGRLAGGIAHDFNNLLTVIVANASLAPESEEMEELLDAADRAAKLTKQLLLVSRRPMGKAQGIDAAAHLHGLERMLRRLTPESLDLSFDAPDPVPVRIDPSHLEQVLLNLVVNAAHATGGHGAVKVSLRAEGEFAHLVVDDDGPGVPAEVRSRVFEPFFTTHGQAGGTGLGLSVVAGIMERSGGSIAVLDGPLGGARFVARFPLVDRLEGAPDAAESIRRAGNGKLLVVEDEPALRAVIERMLTRAGYVVHSTADAEEALRLWEDERPDLLLTDVVMPGCSGPELVRRLRAAHGPFRVLYMSGYPGEHLADVDADAPALLAKPFTPAELQRRVHAALIAG